MAALQVLKLVPEADFSWIERTAGHLRADKEQAELRESLADLNPNDYKSLDMVSADLYKRGTKTSVEMAHKFQEMSTALKNAEADAANTRAISESTRGGVPSEDGESFSALKPGGVVPGSPQATTVPQNIMAAQRGGPAVGGQRPVMPTSRNWGDDEAVAAGLYDKPPTQPATVAQGVPQAAPVQAQPSMAPVPRGPIAAAPLTAPQGAQTAPQYAGPAPGAVAPVAQAPQVGTTGRVIRDPYRDAPPPSDEELKGMVGPEAPAVARAAESPYVRALQTQRAKWASEHALARTASGKDSLAASIRAIDAKIKEVSDQQGEEYKGRVESRKEVEKRDVELGSKRADEIYKQRSADKYAMVGLNRAAQLIDNGLMTGSWSPWRKMTADMANEVGQLMDRLGIPQEKQWLVKNARDMGAASEEFSGLAAKGLFDSLGGFGTAISNRDAATMEKVIADLPKTIEGNRDLVDYHRMVRQARLDSAVAVQQYMELRTKQGFPPRNSDITKIENYYQDKAIDRIAAKAGVDRKQNEPSRTEETPKVKEQPKAASPPKPGDIVGGKKFKGGDPYNPNSWEVFKGSSS